MVLYEGGIKLHYSLPAGPGGAVITGPISSSLAASTYISRLIGVELTTFYESYFSDHGTLCSVLTSYSFVFTKV